jgi:hypothetical protein
VNSGAINLIEIMNIYCSFVEKKFSVKKEIDLLKSNAKLELGILQKYNVSLVHDAVKKCIHEYFLKLNI